MIMPSVLAIIPCMSAGFGATAPVVDKFVSVSALRPDFAQDPYIVKGSNDLANAPERELRGNITCFARQSQNRQPIESPNRTSSGIGTHCSSLLIGSASRQRSGTGTTCRSQATTRIGELPA